MEVQHHTQDGLVGIRHEGRVAHGDVHAHGAEEVGASCFAGVDFDVLDAELVARDLFRFEVPSLRKISSLAIIVTSILTASIA